MLNITLCDISLIIINIVNIKTLFIVIGAAYTSLMNLDYVLLVVVKYMLIVIGADLILASRIVKSRFF